MATNRVVRILIREEYDYDYVKREILGVTTDSRVANAFLELGRFSALDHSVEIVNLNVLDAAILEDIDCWLDPAKNPMCECGHRLLHHRKRKGKGLSCKHNRGQTGDPKHQCKAFTLAKEQPAL